MRKCISFFKGVTLELNLVPNRRDLADVQEIKISAMFINMKTGQLCLEKILKFKGHFKYRFKKKISKSKFLP